MRVAILPAAGPGIRMANYYPIPKQLLPLNNGVVIDYALQAAKYASCWPHVIVPSGDERISRHVAVVNPFSSFSYSLVGKQAGLLADVCSLRAAYGDASILYIMPDTVFKPVDVGHKMLILLDFPLVVGVFETETPEKFGMCELMNVNKWESFQRIIQVEDKPTNWPLTPVAWGVLAWRDEFWDVLASVEADNMTEVIAEAIRRFGPLPTVWMDAYRDIGTPEEFEAAREEGW